MKQFRTFAASIALCALASPALAASPPPLSEVEVVIVPKDPSAHIGKAPKISILPDITIAPLPGAGPVLYKHFSQGDDFGNSDWGAAYNLSGELAGYPAAAVPGAAGDVLQAKARLRADATLFGVTKNIVDVRGSARSEANAGYEGAFDVFVLGSNIFSKDVTGSLNETKNFPRTFFNATASFQLAAVITVGVSGSVTGALGYTISGGPNLGTGAGGLEMHFTPRGQADIAATASAMVLGLVGVGVDGDLNLIKAELPVNAEASLVLTPKKGGESDKAIHYGLDSQLKLSTLSGKLTVWAQGLFRRHEKVIAEWYGISKTYPIFNASGSVEL